MPTIIDNSTNNNTYTSLIQRALDAFDSIQTALHDKKVCYNNNEENILQPTPALANEKGQAITVENLSTYITNQLFRIKGKTSNFNSGNIIQNLTNDYYKDGIDFGNIIYQTTTGGTYYTKVKNETTTYFDFNIKVLENYEGYYDNTSKIKLKISSEDYSLNNNSLSSSTLINDPNDAKYNYYKVELDKIYTDLYLKKAEMNILQSISSSKIDVKPYIDFSENNGDVQIKTQLPARTSSDYFSINYKAKAEKDISITFNSNIKGAADEGGRYSDFSGGYIKNSSDVKIIGDEESESGLYLSTKTVNDKATVESPSETSVFYIPKGNVSIKQKSNTTTGDGGTNNSQQASASIDGSVVWWDNEEDGTATDDNSVLISTNITGTDLNLEAEITEGYIKVNTDADGTMTSNQVNLDSISALVVGGERRIKLTTVSGTTITDTEENGEITSYIITKKADANDILKESSNNNGTDLEITVSASGSSTKNFNEGYLKDGSYTASVDAERKFYINKAVTKINPSASISKSENSSDIFESSGNENDFYKLSVTPKIKTNFDVMTPGFITDDILPSDNTGSKGAAIDGTSSDFYVKKAKNVTNSATIAATYINFTGDNATNDGNGSALDPDKENAILNIFKEDIEENPEYDYYEINATATFSSGEGYITSNQINSANSSTKASDKLYLPKAKLEWVNNGEGKEDFLQVKAGGYLPSGLITEITTVEIEKATVDLGIDTAEGKTSNILNIGTTTIDDGYKISVKKTAQTNAGYISADQGTASQDFYIDKASINSELIIETSEGDVNYNSEDNKYEITVTSNIENKLHLNSSTENRKKGYITGSDLYIKAWEKTENNTSDNGEYSGYSDSGENKTNTATVTTTLSFDPVILDIGTQDTGQGLNISIPKTTDFETCDSLKDSNNNNIAYALSPALAESNIKIKTTQDGYFKTDKPKVLTISDNEAVIPTPINIKRGTGIDFDNITYSNYTDNNKLSFQNSDFSTATDGNYIITLAGSVEATGTLDSGYYKKDTDTSFTGKINLTNVLKDKTLIIPKAVGGITVAATSKVSTGMKTITATEHATASSTKTYIELSSSVDAVEASLNIKNGYIKDGEIEPNTSNSAAAPSETVYVEAFSATTSKLLPKEKEDTANVEIITGIIDETSSTPKRYKMLVGATDASTTLEQAKDLTKKTFATNNKYAEYDTDVVLGEHAMGSTVLTEFEKLLNRLNGSAYAQSEN